ncbi:hypothetical protein TorRG33x02_296810 [Trema orientale]|uniref:Uncharacterized protein n=1 Tax=Trema orientale TaxID=63057 RepID=A0A2P5C5J5_TREOI|nr:hypothetical protein TorRG33x02_296810 [Trema orientale]
MAYQFDQNPPLLAIRYGRKDGEESVEECNYYCEARSKFFDRFQIPCKGNYELEHTSLCKHSHMPLSKVNACLTSIIDDGDVHAHD